MSLPHQGPDAIPEETIRLARAINPKGTLYMHIRDHLVCWLLEASAEKRKGLISSIISSSEYLSCEESVVIRLCFTWLPSGFS